MKKKLIALLLLSCILLTACKNKINGEGGNGGAQVTGRDDSAYGTTLEELAVYDGYFDGESQDVSVTCLSGTQGAYTLDGGTLTFTEISAESVYQISGKLSGNIVIDVGDSYKFDLEMHGFSLVSSSTSPITVLSGDEVSLKAKKDTQNYIYDTRAAVDESDESVYSGAVHSLVDLELAGKGALTLVSESNNGIHSKKDLQVKNLALTVKCKDNALKGNDSVSLENASATLIATVGDGIKTTNSDISNKGNQRGTVSVVGGKYDIFAACDGIDAAYDVVIDSEDTVLNIYTDRYSTYSEEVTTLSESLYYIRFTFNNYKYSVKYYNSDSDYLWVNAEYHSTASGMGRSYYYYSFPKNESYSKMQFFIYSEDMEQSQDTEYLVGSDYITPSEGYDTFALNNRGGYLYYEWTNYTTNVNEGFGGPGGHGPGGPGGFGGEGNSEKGDHSTKGIKAANAITVSNGAISIKSYDDALHANADTTLENGASPTGNLTVNGGSLTVYTNDDALHADGTLTVNGGSITVTHSYEGAEGAYVRFLGGNVSIISSDDGVNATTATGNAVAISGGLLYIYSGGDGIDSNSRTSGEGIVFSGGRTVVISTSGGNSAIDTEAGYTYTAGSVVAVMPSGGMSGEATHCSNFSSIGKTQNISLQKGEYLTAKIDGDELTFRMPTSISGRVILLGDSGASAASESSSKHSLAEGEYKWK